MPHHLRTQPEEKPTVQGDAVAMGAEGTTEVGPHSKTPTCSQAAYIEITKFYSVIAVRYLTTGRCTGPTRACGEYQHSWQGL
jgi:hypothetical protein